ncbi:MAG: beta-ketoacyl-ACP synthase II [Victivallales bacterium]|nr:beta-ketoacyl-ACP synthase II [Victivallales bacterium]
MKSSRRIVVTGLGAVSPVGSTVESAWSNLLAGRSGIIRHPEFAAQEYRCQVCAEVSGLEMDKYLPLKEQQRMDPFCHYGLAAAQQAMDSSGLQVGTNIAPERIGSLVSSGIGGLTTSTQQSQRLGTMGARMVSPLTIPEIIADMATGHIAIRFNLQGPNFGIVSACASGLHAIGEAAWIIQRGDAEAMLAGGTEAGVVALGQAAFGAMRALTTSHNDDPEHASRPFDATRDGFVPGAGAGVLVLAELSHAQARGAHILAELSGYGATCDAHHITAPVEDGSGAARAIRIALEHAGLAPEAIGYVNALGTSTHLNDLVETRALKLALGDHAYHTAISSTKSMTGHMLGAAGGFESVVCVQALLHGIAPGTMNLENPDPECDLDYLPKAARELPALRHALKLNMGFGGHNAAVVYSKFEE